MKNKKGFSLTELLAVVVLLGVIIAIAVPSYDKYIEKTKEKKYESYEYAMEDAAEMYIQHCLVKNKCPNDLSYSEILGQRIPLSELGIEGDLSECEIDDSYVKVNHDGSENTEIDNYDYKVCLVCGEHRSEYCDPVVSPEEEEQEDVIINLDNNKIEENTPVPEKPEEENNVVKTEITVYTNKLNYTFKDDDFDISKTEYPKEKCKSDKKGGIECSLTNSDFIDDKAQLMFTSKKSQVILTVIYDNIVPTIKAHVDNEKWATEREVTFTYSDIKSGINPNSLTLDGKPISSSTNITTSGKYEVCIEDTAGNKGCTNFGVENVTQAKPTITIQALDRNKYYDSIYFDITSGAVGMSYEKVENVYAVDAEANVLSLKDLTTIVPQQSGNNYTIKGLTGIKDIYIQVFENEAGISSGKGVETITISGKQYHKFSGIKFDNKEPEISVVVDNTKWTTARTVTFKYNDDNGIASIKWKRIADSTEKTITPTSKIGEETVDILESDEYVVCVKDVAGKGGSKVGDDGCVNFNVSNVTQKKPTITLISDKTIYSQEHSFRVASGAYGMNYEEIEKIYVADNEIIVSSLNDLTEFTLQQNVNDKNVYTTDKGLTGIKDIYIKVFKNEAGISSGQGVKTETISGEQYHKFSDIKFDSTPPTCSITAKYEGNVVTSGKYPYLTLHGSVSDSPSGHDGTYSWDNGAGTSQAPKVSDKKNYTLTVYDKAGNRGTCSYNTTDKIDGTAPTITFLYNGSTTAPTAWRNTNVTLTAKLQSKNSANLLYYNYNNTGKKTINSTSYTTGTLATFSTTGSHSGSLVTAIQGLTGEITAQKSSETIKIDKVVPTVNSITISSFVGNKNNSKREVLQSGNTYTIKYHDPNETRWDWNLNTDLTGNYDPVTLSLGINATDAGGAGISGNFIQYNRTSEYISKAEFDNRIQAIVNNMPSGEDNIRTIYIKVRDTAGNLSNEITIRLFRKTNNLVGW